MTLGYPRSDMDLGSKVKGLGLELAYSNMAWVWTLLYLVVLIGVCRFVSDLASVEVTGTISAFFALIIRA